MIKYLCNLDDSRSFDAKKFAGSVAIICRSALTEMMIERFKYKKMKYQKLTVPCGSGQSIMSFNTVFASLMKIAWASSTKTSAPSLEDPSIIGIPFGNFSLKAVEFKFLVQILNPFKIQDFYTLL